MELVTAEPSKQLGLEGGAGAEILQGRNGWSLWMSHGLPKFFTAEGLSCGPEPTTGIAGKGALCNHQALAPGQWVGLSHLRSLCV